MDRVGNRAGKLGLDVRKSLSTEKNGGTFSVRACFFCVC